MNPIHYHTTPAPQSSPNTAILQKSNIEVRIWHYFPEEARQHALLSEANGWTIVKTEYDLQTNKITIIGNREWNNSNRN